MHRKLPISALVIGALVVSAAGCGGSGSDSSADGKPKPIITSPLSKTEYVKEVNEICTEGRDEREAKSEEYAEENRDMSQKELIASVTHEIYVPGKEADLEAMRAIGAPNGNEHQVEEMILAFEKAIHTLSELEGSGNTPTFNKQLNNAGVLARKYNLIQCTYG